jgi:hypothetical protein
MKFVLTIESFSFNSKYKNNKLHLHSKFLNCIHLYILKN